MDKNLKPVVKGTINFGYGVLIDCEYLIKVDGLLDEGVVIKSVVFSEG